MATTPRELANRIGIDQRRIRVFLRSEYRPNGEDKNARWLLDDEQVAEVKKHFGR
ncbi:hypothetical protein [Demequina sp. NBRC 110052]|uniref:hypothetical protein n=1 Tax=Demequina sp. NBRC 110052 TaxID=1570341 RepID=UPI0013565355|nr:hypothetical protein [Demequina sp. NBRC 110052]